MIDQGSERLNSTLERIEKTNEETWEVQGELSALANRISLMLEKMLATGNTSTSAITINGTGAVALILAVIGVFAITIAVAAVLIMAADRRADMRSLDDMRSRIEQMESVTDTNRVYIQQMREQRAKEQP